jgi:co-chaperonin GroES (HSP10)
VAPPVVTRIRRDYWQSKQESAKSFALGPGIKVGDRVLFGKWSGTEVKIDGQELLIMKESDIMGIIDEPAAKKRAA